MSQRTPNALLYLCAALGGAVAYESIENMHGEGWLLDGLSVEEAFTNYRKAIKKGLHKVMSKMGISTVQSYQGAQIFEAVGLNQEVIERYFTGTTSQIEGVGLEIIAEESLRRHRFAYLPKTEAETELDVGGKYHFRVRGEQHLLNPVSVSKLQHAVDSNRFSTYQEFSSTINDMNKTLCTLRGLFEFKKDEKSAVPLEEVEPASEIVTWTMFSRRISATKISSLLLQSPQAGLGLSCDSHWEVQVT